MSSTNGSTFGRMLSQMDAKQISALPAGESSCGLTESELRTLASELANWLRGDYAIELDRLVIQPKFDAHVKRTAARPVGGAATDLSDGVITALARGLVPFLRETIAEALSPLGARLTVLEQNVGELDQRKYKGLAPFVARLAQLEAKPSLQYEGTWNEAKTYSCGALVTFQGGLWHCEDTNMGVRPGAGSSSWKLAVKRGRADR